ncbi:MAG: undecaprenyl-diphosphate phosphatase [Limnochordales bacterium]|nr:undecaprenyl-diphosphate phosphatase [Limnochordales bacterium]
MSLWYAVLLGLVQGLTEFLPVSSSGHLALTQAVLGVTPGLAFDVLLHVATLVAVVVAYRQEVVKLARATASLVVPGTWKGEAAERRQQLSLLLALLIGSIPAGLAGVLLEDEVELLLASPRTIGLYFWATSLFLLAADMVGRTRPVDRHAEIPTLGQSLLVGIAQAVAIFPGVSRSGSTITAGLVAGLSREGAARFSFLLSMPVIAGAGLLEAPEFVAAISSSRDMLVFYLAGAFCALLAGYIAIRLLIRQVTRGRLLPFAVYLFVLGALTLFYLR